MRYCVKCVTADTRPNVELDAEGVCNACRSSATKRVIDWVEREKAFRDVVENAKRRSSGYDCLIPVSGGKDSIWQVSVCLEHGLRPLAVTWKTPARTAIGQANLDCLVQMGVDHIDYQISPAVERKFMLKAFERFGSTAIPMHMAIFNIPVKIAVRFEIPLVVWGENSAFEYGGKEDERTGFRLDATWMRKYGMTHGTTARDWVSPELSEKELAAYVGPSADEVQQRGILAVFLGYYFGWDPERSRNVAATHGFKSGDRARTGYWDYADIDDDFISIHHWLKWYKFGFTRLFDNLSVDIRAGRVTREQAVRIIREAGDQTPREDIAKFCAFAGIPVAQFMAIAERFRNHSIWKQVNGVWTMPEFLIQDWPWAKTTTAGGPS